jgi:hypothetical protein
MVEPFAGFTSTRFNGLEGGGSFYQCILSPQGCNGGSPCARHGLADADTATLSTIASKRGSQSPSYLYLHLNLKSQGPSGKLSSQGVTCPMTLRPARVSFLPKARQRGLPTSFSRWHCGSFHMEGTRSSVSVGNIIKV